MTIHIPYEPPLDWQFMLGYIERRRTQGVELIKDNQYVRTIDVNGDSGTLTVRDEPKRCRLVVTVDGDVCRHLDTVEARVRRMFDIDSNQREIQNRLGSDPLIGPLCEAFPGIRIPGAWSTFELLVRTIVGQQVSVSAATTIMGRIVLRAGRPVYGKPATGTPPNGSQHGGATLLFPKPQSIATADLGNIGMPGRRVAALQHVAGLIASERIPFPDNGAEDDDVTEALLQVPGIGPWTVAYFALRALKNADAWPQTDLILRRMLEKHPMAEKRSMRSISDGWRPYRGYAAIYLWHAASLPDHQPGTRA